VNTLRAQRAWLLGGVFGILLAASPLASASEQGQAAAAQVTDASYRAVLGDRFGIAGILYTHQGHNRGVGGAQHDPAMYNIRDAMLSFGLTVTMEPFLYYGTTYYNVVGTQWGTVYPDQEYVIGAHYDSVDNPGADDNASGVAGVLEAARILTQYDSEYTIRYIAFDREEQGLYGSEAYVADHATDDILGMFSLDMIAYDTNTNVARIYGRDAYQTLLNSLGAAILEYGDNLTWMDAGWINASDHAPFSDAGFPAGLLIEGEVWNNPYYHQSTDHVENPSNINYTYAVNMTRSVVGWLVDTANVWVDVDALKFTYPNGRPEFVAPHGGTRVRVVVEGLGDEVPQPGTGMLHCNLGTGWLTFPMDEISPNVYDAVFPPALCRSQVPYYFSAQAVSGSTYYGPSGAPAAGFSATASYGWAVIYENLFNSNPGWTISGGQWAFGHPTGGGGEYGGPDPNNGYTGTNVYGYNLSGDYANSIPEYHLTSTPINCTGYTGVRLQFRRWLGVERSQYDHAYVRVSNNGSTYTTVWQNPNSETADTSWQLMDLDVSAVADNQSAVRLRWTMGTTDTAWRYCGWNIDDVQLVALSCTPPYSADGDFDGDGDVDLADFAAFQGCLSGAGVPFVAESGCEVFNFDFDLDVDITDYEEFESLLTGP